MLQGRQDDSIRALREDKIDFPTAEPPFWLQKSGSVMRVADDRLPALLPNLDTDTGELSASSISGVHAGWTIIQQS